MSWYIALRFVCDPWVAGERVRYREHIIKVDLGDRATHNVKDVTPDLQKKINKQSITTLSLHTSQEQDHVLQHLGDKGMRHAGTTVLCSPATLSLSTCKKHHTEPP